MITSYFEGRKSSHSRLKGKQRHDYSSLTSISALLSGNSWRSPVATQGFEWSGEWIRTTDLLVPNPGAPDYRRPSPWLDSPRRWIRLGRKRHFVSEVAGLMDALIRRLQ